MDLTRISPYKHILKTAEMLKAMSLEKPSFVDFVKSGAHKQRPPEHEDFFYIRAAAILRKAAKMPVGVNRLRKAFGGRKTGRVKPEHKRKAGGKIIRAALQNLEKLGLLKKTEKGRVITNKGMQLLSKAAKEAR
ncbi:MAG: 40S ribosomal protein S19 [Candidatus Anstonellales archaeon]